MQAKAKAQHELPGAKPGERAEPRRRAGSSQSSYKRTKDAVDIS